MSEYTEIVIMCDNCFPDYLPSFTFFRLEAVKGVFRGVWEDAEAAGWEQRDYGHACPECVRVEQEQNEDGGEVVLGGAAVASVSSLFQTQEEEPDGEAFDPSA